MFGTNEADFPHKLLLTDRQVENLWKSLCIKVSSVYLKLSKTRKRS